MAASSSSSDLLIRETILGVIKSRDLNREGIIHTSDFRAAVSDLGFPFGHPIIENILVHCVINNDGFVDFKGLERELAR
jgi:Ca2+-binding EF-hand superfamily protein